MQNFLRALRKGRGLTLKDLADKTGVGSSTIGNFETGTTEVSAEFLGKMSEALGVPISQILKGPAARASRNGADSDAHQTVEEHFGGTIRALLRSFDAGKLIEHLNGTIRDKKLTPEQRLNMIELIALELERKRKSDEL